MGKPSQTLDDTQIRRMNDHPATTAAEERLQASNSKAEINRASDDTQIGRRKDLGAATAEGLRLCSFRSNSKKRPDFGKLKYLSSVNNQSHFPREGCPEEQNSTCSRPEIHNLTEIEHGMNNLLASNLQSKMKRRYARESQAF